MIGTQLRVYNSDSRRYSHREFDHFFEVEGDTRDECLNEAAIIHGRVNTAVGSYDEGTSIEWAGPYEIALTIHEGDDPENPDNYYFESGAGGTQEVEQQPSYAYSVAEKKLADERKKAADEAARKKQLEAHERQMLAKLQEKYGADRSQWHRVQCSGACQE